MAITAEERLPFFDRIVGHGKEIAFLESLVQRGTVPHGFIFGGPSAIGKMTAAHAFASTLFAAFRSEELPLPAVVSAIGAGTYPDLHVVRPEEGKKEIAVEEIRNLCQKLRLKPYYPSCTVALVDEAHRMSGAASNALLRTLEEPVQNTYIILVSDAPHRLLPTITSRCQLVSFNSLDDRSIAGIFEKHIGPHVRQQQDADTLKLLLDGSLASLSLASHVEYRTMAWRDPAALTEHLEAIAENSRRHGDLLLQVNSGKRNPLSVASEIISEAGMLPLFWSTFRSFVRTKLRASGGKECRRWASLLDQVLSAEILIAERNLSPHAHLPQLFLELREAG